MRKTVNEFLAPPARRSVTRRNRASPFRSAARPLRPSLTKSTCVVVAVLRPVVVEVVEDGVPVERETVLRQVGEREGGATNQV
jgi:hypothetical protein